MVLEASAHYSRHLFPLIYSQTPLNPYPYVTTLSYGLSEGMGFEGVTKA